MLALVLSIYSIAQETVKVVTTENDTVEVKTAVSPASPQQQSNSSVQTEPVVREQEKKSKIDKSKIYYGGYVNLSFGRYTRIGVEPLVGYKITPKFSLGAKLSYNYVNDKRYNTDYRSDNFGFSVLSRYRLTQRIYAHAEYQMVNYKFYYTDGTSDRQWVPFLFLGGGFSQPITKNSWLTAEVLFDVLQNENSPYKNWEPFFSIGVGVGF
jgi:hypothetical protein